MIEGHENKNIPVMETTIEGAQKRIAELIEFNEWFIEGMGKLAPEKTLSPLRTIATDLEYIGVFIDTVGDEMAAMSSSCNSLHDRYVEAVANANQLQADFDTVDSEAAGHLADKIELQKEIDELRKRMDLNA